MLQCRPQSIAGTRPLQAPVHCRHQSTTGTSPLWSTTGPCPPCPSPNRLMQRLFYLTLTIDWCSDWLPNNQLMLWLVYLTLTIDWCSDWFTWKHWCSDRLPDNRLMQLVTRQYTDTETDYYRFTWYTGYLMQLVTWQYTDTETDYHRFTWYTGYLTMIYIYIYVCVCAKWSQSDAQDPVVHVRWLMKILNPAYSKIIYNDWECHIKAINNNNRSVHLQMTKLGVVAYLPAYT